MTVAAFVTHLVHPFWLALSGMIPPASGQKGARPTERARPSNGENQPPFDEKNALEGLHRLDPQAITDIHNRFYPEVYRFARYRLNDSQLVEDIASEVFIQLLEAVHAGRGPHTSLRGWLIATASNLVNNHYRKQYRRTFEELSDDLPADHPGMLAALESAERQTAVKNALQKLTAEQQNILALRFGAGYSLEQTAETIGKTVNAVKQLQFRAVAALRRHLGEATL